MTGPGAGDGSGDGSGTGVGTGGGDGTGAGLGDGRPLSLPEGGRLGRPPGLDPRRPLRSGPARPDRALAPARPPAPPLVRQRAVERLELGPHRCRCRRVVCVNGLAEREQKLRPRAAELLALVEEPRVVPAGQARSASAVVVLRARSRARPADPPLGRRVTVVAKTSPSRPATARSRKPATTASSTSSSTPAASAAAPSARTTIGGVTPYRCGSGRSRAGGRAAVGAAPDSTSSRSAAANTASAGSAFPQARAASGGHEAPSRRRSPGRSGRARMPPAARGKAVERPQRLGRLAPERPDEPAVVLVGDRPGPVVELELLERRERTVALVERQAARRAASSSSSR